MKKLKLEKYCKENDNRATRQQLISQITTLLIKSQHHLDNFITYNQGTNSYRT